MTKLERIESAVSDLSAEEFAELREWFLQRDWEKWDRQIEEDSAAGKLDVLLAEARDAKESGKLSSL